jgi:hypothetical protein
VLGSCWIARMRAACRTVATHRVKRAEGERPSADSALSTAPCWLVAGERRLSVRRRSAVSRAARPALRRCHDASVSSTRGTTEPDRSASVQVLSPEVALSRDPDALIREARRRQWRRYLTTILALMSAAGLAAGLALAAGVSRGGHLPPGSHSRRPPGIRAAVHAVTAAPVPRSLHTTLLMWAWSLGPPVLDNLAARRTQQGNVLDISVGDYQYPIMHSGRWLVWIGNGATAIRDDLSGRPRILASTPDVAPAAQPGYIWLENGPANNPPQPRPIRLASIATGRTGPPIELPSGLALIAGTHAGLLVVDNQGRFEIWLPGSQPRPVPFAGSYQVGFGFSASVVSYW